MQYRCVGRSGGVFRRERLVGIDHARLGRSMHYKSQTLRLDLNRVRNSWGKSTLHGREFHEASHCHHQAVQARRRARVAVGDRRAGHYRHRGQGLRPPERPYRAVSRCRVRGRLPAQGEDRRGHR
ncbi:UNVERIFIED_CONTAM: hypothetical protein NCL1_41573 [Trichonephila clavipes]